MYCLWSCTFFLIRSLRPLIRPRKGYILFFLLILYLRQILHDRNEILKRLCTPKLILFVLNSGPLIAKLVLEWSHNDGKEKGWPCRYSYSSIDSTVFERVLPKYPDSSIFLLENVFMKVSSRLVSLYLRHKERHNLNNSFGSWWRGWRGLNFILFLMIIGSWNASHDFDNAIMWLHSNNHLQEAFVIELNDWKYFWTLWSPPWSMPSFSSW